MSTAIAGARELTGEVRPVEGRAEIEPLEVLHAERRALLREYSKLRALHGSNGKWDAKRKMMLEAMKIKARANMTKRGDKITEAAVDAEAHADDDYTSFVIDGITGSTRYVEVETLVKEIEERIESRTAELYFVGKEIGLQR